MAHYMNATPAVPALVSRAHCEEIARDANVTDTNENQIFKLCILINWFRYINLPHCLYTK